MRAMENGQHHERNKWELAGWGILKTSIKIAISWKQKKDGFRRIFGFFNHRFLSSSRLLACSVGFDIPWHLEPFIWENLVLRSQHHQASACDFIPRFYLSARPSFSMAVGRVCSCQLRRDQASEVLSPIFGQSHMSLCRIRTGRKVTKHDPNGNQNKRSGGTMRPELGFASRGIKLLSYLVRIRQLRRHSRSSSEREGLSRFSSGRFLGGTTPVSASSLRGMVTF